MKAKLFMFSVLLLPMMSCQMEAQKNGENTYVQNPLNPMQIQYAYTILYVQDVAQTMKFYQEAFGFKQKLLTPE
ncbi:MAG: VOC family protein, partial [Bacteroidota bacterium]